MITIVPELGVASVASSVKYFEDLFGAKLVESVLDDSGGFIWAEIDVVGSSLMFEEVNALAEEFDGVGPENISLGSGCIVFRVSDVELAKTFYNNAQRNNTKFAMDWVVSDYGTAEFAIHDLDGNIIVVSSKVQD